eukprot:COSAG01_NODE_5249_length_4385_cov_9.553663_1_plen_143_part_00
MEQPPWKAGVPFAQGVLEDAHDIARRAADQRRAVQAGAERRLAARRAEGVAEAERELAAARLSLRLCHARDAAAARVKDRERAGWLVADAEEQLAFAKVRCIQNPSYRGRVAARLVPDELRVVAVDPAADGIRGRTTAHQQG